MRISNKMLFVTGMVAFAAALVFVAVSTDRAKASPGLVTADLSGQTPTDLANTLLGGGITVSNVTYAGANVAGGTFSGGTGIIGFESGVILGSGDIAFALGPNVDDGITWVNSTAGDAQLTTLASNPTFDAAVLEFDFVPAGSVLQFDYVFASDEYNEFVNSSFNDVFAFYVNGTNCALVPGTSDPVSINTINNGNPFGSVGSNPAYYRNNDLDDGGGGIDTEMDGLTTVLTCTAAVNSGVTNHMKLAIADAGDDVLDSNVFLRAGSFAIPTPTATSTNTPTATPTDTNTPTVTNTPIPGTPTDTATATNTPTSTSTTAAPTNTNTPTPTNTTAAPTNTNTPSPTNTPVPPTNTPTNTPVPGTNTPTNTPVPATNTPTPAGPCDRADLNGDGHVTIVDVLLIAIKLGHAKKGFDVDLDVDLDGKVTAKDLVFVVKCRNEEKKH